MVALDCSVFTVRVHVCVKPDSRTLLGLWPGQWPAHHGTKGSCFMAAMALAGEIAKQQREFSTQMMATAAAQAAAAEQITLLESTLARVREDAEMTEVEMSQRCDAACMHES